MMGSAKALAFDTKPSECDDTLLNELGNILSLLEHSLDYSHRNIDTSTMETSLLSLRDLSNCLLKKDNLDSEKFFTRIKNYLENLNEIIQIKLNTKNSEQSDALVYEIYSRFLLIQYNINGTLNSPLRIKNIFIAVKLLLKACRIWMLNKSIPDAEKSLDFINLCLDVLRKLVKDESASSVNRINIIKYQTIVKLCYLEMSINEREHEKSYRHFSEVQKIVYDFPLLQNFLTDLCYNNGVKYFNEENYEQSVFWLRESYGLRRDGKSLQSNQVLKLLATVYMKWDAKKFWEKALEAIKLADTNTKQKEYSLDHLYILLHSKNRPAIEEFTNKIIKSFNNNVNSDSIKFVELLMEFDYHQLASKCIEILIKSISQDQFKKILSLQLCIYFEQRNFEEAKNVLKQYIKLLQSILDAETDHIVVSYAVEIGTMYFKKKIYDEAILWYQFCLRIYEETEKNFSDENLIDYMNWLKRQLCFSYIEIRCVSKAKELLSNEEFFGKETVLNKILVLNLAIILKDEKLIEKSLNFLVLKVNENKETSESTVSSVIIHLLVKQSQFAIENDEIPFILQIFNKLINAIFCNYPIKLKLLQCFVQLKILNMKENLNYKTILSDIEKSKECLQIMQQDNQDIIDECIWFSKVCWNGAIQKNMPQLFVFQLFSMGWKILNVINNANVNIIIRRNSFLLSAIASGLYLYRNEKNEGNMNDVLSDMISIIDQYKKNNDLSGDDENDRLFIQVLLLYEFEVRIILKSPVLQSCFFHMMNMTELDAKFFEVLASLSMEHGLLYCEITITALKTAIAKNLQRTCIDMTQLSRNYHSLIHIMMQVLNSGKTDINEDMLLSINELLNIIKTKSNGQYPEIELVWIMVECWNCGIYFLMRDDKQHAYEWCQLSLQFLQNLNVLKSIHEDKMNSMFKDLFG